MGDSTWAPLELVPILERQLDADGELASAQEDPSDEPIPAVTYNNGMWTPAAATQVATPTLPAFTATVALAPTSAEDAVSATELSSQTALPSRSSASSRLSSASVSSMSSSLSSTDSASSTSTSSASPSATSVQSEKHSGGGGGFKLVYLAPILVFVGLLLLFSVGGRMWGRIHHASRVEAARRAKFDKRASRQAKKREMQRIKTMWGYDKTPMLPAELPPGEHDLHYKDPNSPTKKSKASGSGLEGADSSFGSDSDGGHGDDEKYPGTFKILSLALLGEGTKPAPPITRGESERKYETELQSNSWLAVKIRRWIGKNETDAVIDDSRYTSGPCRSGTGAGRRLRHALSRDRFRADADGQDVSEKEALHSPATTLSVGSGELKYKAEFATVDLHHSDPSLPTNFLASPTRKFQYSGLSRNGPDVDDPFVEKAETGWRKPLPPQPQESPFRPAVLNFGLRSRSKTYDQVSSYPAAAERDTPVKPTAAYAAIGDEDAGIGSGYLPKAFGLGISGVWRAMTNFGATEGRRNNVEDHEDEESFVARPYRATSELMSESDTPYSVRNQDRYGEAGTPTRGASRHESPYHHQPLARNSTVLNVKTNTNQPWNARQQEASGGAGRKMTAAAWNEALLSSPVNKQQQHQNTFQPLVSSDSPRPPPAVESTKRGVQTNLAPRKSLLLHQAIAANNGVVESTHGASPSFTDYSDLVACYSTPSDAVQSPEVAHSIRAVTPSLHTETSDGGSRAKLQRAKTAKSTEPGANERAVQRSKTATTDSTRGGLSRKGTVHHTAVKKERSTTHVQDDSSEAVAAREVSKGLYPYPLTQPLRLAKQEPARTASPVRSIPIPQRGSSSPVKSHTVWNAPKTSGAGPHLPSSLMIASPEPLLPAHPNQISLGAFHSRDYEGFASLNGTDSEGASPPKRAKAVSNRSVEEDPSAGAAAGMARMAAQKAKNRSTALQTVDQIVSQSYASQLPPQQYRS